MRRNISGAFRRRYIPSKYRDRYPSASYRHRNVSGAFRRRYLPAALRKRYSSSVIRYGNEDEELKTLEELKKSEEIKKSIRWDLTPEEVESDPETTGDFNKDLGRKKKKFKEQAGYYFYISVSFELEYNYTSGDYDDSEVGHTLVLVENKSDGSSELIAEIYEIPQALLDEAIEEADAKDGEGIYSFVDDGAYYPINEKIKDWLKVQLGCE